jgi:hypothetical protein
VQVPVPYARQRSDVKGRYRCRRCRGGRERAKKETVATAREEGVD